MTKSKNGINFAAISRSNSLKFWNGVEPSKLKDYLTKIDTYGNESKIVVKGSKILIRCRFDTHAGKDVNPSLELVPAKGYARCHACKGYTNSLIEVASMISKKDHKTVVKELQSYCNVKILKAGDVKEAEEYSKHTSMKNQLAKVFNSELLEAIDHYRAGTLKDSELYYADNMIKYLENRDPALLDFAGNLPIGIFVTAPRLLKAARAMGISTVTIEAMKAYIQKYLVDYYMGALVMIYHESINDVARFRLRLPDAVSENGATEKIIRAIPDEYTSDLGLFGLGASAGVMDVQSKEPKAILCEGEFDAMAILVNQMKNNDPSWIAISHSGGTSSSKLDPLLSTPISEIFYVPDHDAGGLKNAQLVLSDNPDLSIKVFNWPLAILPPTQGPFDVFDSIKSFGFAKVNSEFKEYDKNYAKRGAWARNRVTEECRHLDIDDTQELHKVKENVQEYARCIGGINDPTKNDEVKKWISDVLSSMGVSSTEISSVTISASAEDDPEKEFIAFLTLTLSSSYFFVSYDLIERVITLWDKDKRAIVYLRTGSDAGLKTDIGNILGDVISWVITQVPGGVPEFVTYMDPEKEHRVERNYLQVDALLNDYLRMTIRHQIPKLNPIETFEKKADGVHWLDTAGGKKLFIVNGNHVFMGTFSEGDLFWEELSVPVYENYYFDLSKLAWSKHAVSLQKLRNAPDVSLKDILERNRDILDIGWTFINQVTEPMLLATWATASSIVKIFPNNMQFLASNERGCGKSALYAELFGGGKGTQINITEHTQYVDNITPAGMRQAMDGSGRILIIDEFDNQKGSRGTQEKQEEVLTMLRTASGGDGVFMQGTTSGKPRKYVFSVSTMMAGIDPEMTEANQTRLITTDLQSGLDSRLPPQATILAKYNEEAMVETQMWNTLCMFRNVPEIARCITEIRNALLEKPNLLGEDVMQRFKDSLINLLAVIKAAYPDKPGAWIEWGRKICKAKKTNLKNLNNATANAELIDSLLYTSGVEVVSALDKKTFSLLQLLSSGEIIGDQTSINNSNVGVWLHAKQSSDINDPVKYYLFIQWKNILSTLFRYNTKWKQSATQLKTIAGRHDLVLKDKEAITLYQNENGIPGWIGAGGEGSFSVLDVSKYINECSERESAHYAHATSNDYANSLQQPKDEVADNFSKL